jgi:hypothetical protein
MSNGNLLIIMQQQRDEIDNLTKRLSTLESLFKDEIKGKVHVVDLSVDLPLHLRRTLNFLNSLGGRASAKQVAEASQQIRSVESMRLNELVRMKVISKRYEGRAMYFYSKIEKKIIP